MKQLNHKQLKEFLKVAYNKKISTYIWGAFGIGKSAVVKQVSEELNIRLIDVRVSQLEPSDVRGLPKIENNTTKWFYPNWLPAEDKGILFLDEINLAVPSIQASLYQLILDRRIGDYILPKDWFVVCAGNRLEDKANIFELPSPLANRFVHIELKIPSVKEWQNWAFDNDISEKIIAFLNFKPEYLFKFDSKYKDKSIPTPRSWAFCSSLIKDVNGEELLDNLISSSVGEGVAIEMNAFLRLRKTIDIKDLIENPNKIKEIEEIGLKWALLSAITEYYKQNKEEKIFRNIIKICKLLEAEYTFLLLKFIIKVDKEYFRKEVKNNKEADELVKKLIDFAI